MTSPENTVKVTISPTELMSWIKSQMPAAMMDRTVSVVAERVSTVNTAHHVSAGNWAPSSRRLIPPSARTSSSILAKLCTSATLPSVSDACSARSEWCDSTRDCSADVLRSTRRVTATKSTDNPMSNSARRQFMLRAIGISTTSATKAARCSRKKPSQSAHIESVPWSMIFISLPE